MGTSYLGAGPEGERVVVKVIHPELSADPDFHVRFVRESASAREIDSPDTARVLAADPDSETPWIATEYIDGITLERTVADFGVLDTAALRILATGLARALEELHGNDLVHGDLNPRDVVLVEDGIRLVDFGGGRLATRLPDDVHDLAVDQVREGKAADVGTGTLVEPGSTHVGGGSDGIEGTEGAAGAGAAGGGEAAGDGEAAKVARSTGIGHGAQGDRYASSAPGGQGAEAEVPDAPAPTGEPVAGQPPAPTGRPVSVEPPDPTGKPFSVDPPVEEGPDHEALGEGRTEEDAGSARGCPLAHIPYKAPEQVEGAMGDAFSDMFALATVLVYAATGQNPFAASSDEECAHRLTGDAPETHDLPVLLRTLVAACWNRTPESRPTSAQFAAALANSEPPEQKQASWAEGGDDAGPLSTPGAAGAHGAVSEAALVAGPVDGHGTDARAGSPAGSEAGSDTGAPASAPATSTDASAVPPSASSASSAVHRSSAGAAYPVAQGHSVPEGQDEPELAPNRTGTFQLPGPEDVRRYEQGEGGRAGSVSGGAGGVAGAGLAPGEGPAPGAGTGPSSGSESGSVAGPDSSLGTVSEGAHGRSSDTAVAAAAAAAVSAVLGEPEGDPERTGTFTRRGRESTPARGGGSGAAGRTGNAGVSGPEVSEAPGGSFGPAGSHAVGGDVPQTVVARWAAGRPHFGALPPCPQGLPPGPAEVSPDGSIIAVASYGAICLWNGHDGTHLGEFTGFGKSVNVVAFNADGTLLASGHEDRCVRVWDVANMRPLGVLAGHTGTVSCLEFSPDGNFLVSGSGDRHVLLWDVRIGRSVVSFPGHEDMVLSVSFSPDGSTILSGSSDRSARMWRTDGTPVAMLADYETVAPMVSATAFNAAKPVMLTGDSGGVVRTWASDTGAEGPRFAGHHDLICDARFSADGSSLITAGWDGQVFVRDTVHYAPAAALRTGQARLRCASLTRDGHMIVASGAGSPVLVWRL